MTTATQVIQAAYREGNIIPVGQQPTAAEQTEALDRLNAYILGVYGQELGENLSDWPFPAPQRTAPVAANYPQAPYPQDLDSLVLTSPFAGDPSTLVYPYPPKNSRIVFGNVAGTLFFHEAPDDGSRMAIVQGSGAGDSGTPGATIILDGNGRTIEGANTQSYSQPVAGRQWLYRADLGDWTAVLTLALTDNIPFPPEFDDLWICLLNIRLAPRYHKEVSSETKLIATQMLKTLKTRYRQQAVTTYGSSDFPRALESYISGRWFW